MPYDVTAEICREAETMIQVNGPECLEADDFAERLTERVLARMPGLWRSVVKRAAINERYRLTAA